MDLYRALGAPVVWCKSRYNNADCNEIGLMLGRGVLVADTDPLDVDTEHEIKKRTAPGLRQACGRQNSHARTHRNCVPNLPTHRAGDYLN